MQTGIGIEGFIEEEVKGSVGGRERGIVAKREKEMDGGRRTMEGVLLESRRKAVLRQRTSVGQHVRAMLAVANAKSLPPAATVEGGTKGILDQKLASTGRASS